MKPDTDPVDGSDRQPIERAHLNDPTDTSSRVFRYPASSDLAALMRRYWIPVWSVPEGQDSVQRVLQYPVCLAVVAEDYARFYGITSGLSRTTLAGDGWAVGVMFTPAAGHLLTRTPVAAFTDRFVDLSEVFGDSSTRLAGSVRAAMADAPRSPESHRVSMDLFDDMLRPFATIDDEGHLINEVVAFVEDNPDVLRVEQVRDEFGLSERALQRLVHRRIGLTPKWLIQRRRLQEAAGRLRERATPLAEMAALLGYADQPHFVRDFAKVVGMTPAVFAQRYGL
ncbi:MAG TPA: AraC family transcriptional regulator [Rhodococcus sp. (in: high G+C Gram-positive bacteria)]|uniref:helix-turn-helix domain-containing protein n=1 Tax=Rhodococcus sp. SMB37 TaxID=2512213 RepID=UPI001048F1F3|nr:AraC family transcriptional regulator [Rhodococcus sp. SMB37]TCN55773.1 AraC-like DNA-binding protein [Rhodococcus sp. SMB37]HET8992282.1 AraC family transcriptional regulator [Rhodococcus sp. (in: high G+C Gram-positive bacteria)]